jgi:hypothetical protein
MPVRCGHLLLTILSLTGINQLFICGIADIGGLATGVSFSREGPLLAALIAN